MNQRGEIVRKGWTCMEEIQCLEQILWASSNYVCGNDDNGGNTADDFVSGKLETNVVSKV